MLTAGSLTDRRTTPEPRAVDGTPRALEALLDAYPEPVRARARTVLGHLLADRLSAQGESAWRGSPLTGDGFPVEAAFTTTDARLRMTVEPGSPDLRPADRLDLAARLVADVGGRAVPADLLDRLRRQQTDLPLRYGAWVSCRVSADAIVLKLYAEVPDPAWRWPGLPDPVLEDRAMALRMVAVTPASGDVECYLRGASLWPHHLPDLLTPVGLGHLSSRVERAVQLLHGQPLRGRLPGPSVGVSYTLGDPRRVTLHFYARALWGGDARIRREYSRLARALGADPTTYDAVTSPLADRRAWATRHGIVGLGLGGDTPASLTLGVRPVAA